MRTFVVTIEDSSVAEEPSAIFGNVKGILSIKETKESKFKNLALPGPPLTDEEMEELAQEMEDDIKFNLDSFMTVEQLKSSLDEELKDLFASNKTK
jgi:fructose-1-phosphate kinase PfkB-like protein